MDQPDKDRKIETEFYLHSDDNYYWTPEAWEEFNRLKVDVAILSETRREIIKLDQERCRVIDHLKTEVNRLEESGLGMKVRAAGLAEREMKIAALEAEVARLRASVVSRDEKDVHIEKLKAEVARLKRDQAEFPNKLALHYKAEADRLDKMAESYRSIIADLLFVAEGGMPRAPITKSSICEQARQALETK